MGGWPARSRSTTPAVVDCRSDPCAPSSAHGSSGTPITPIWSVEGLQLTKLSVAYPCHRGRDYVGSPDQRAYARGLVRYSQANPTKGNTRGTKP